MGRPTTLRERIDQLGDELTNDPKLFSGVLDSMLQKKAAAETPKRVLDIADTIEKEIGIEKSAALKMAWQTYVKYVNPTHPMPESMREKVAVAPAPVKIETRSADAVDKDLAAKLASIDEAGDADVDELKKGLGL